MASEIIANLGNGSRQAIVGLVAVGVAVWLKSPSWGLIAHTAASALAAKFIDGTPALSAATSAAPGTGVGALGLFTPIG